MHYIIILSKDMQLSFRKNSTFISICMCIRDKVHFLSLSYSKISMKTQVEKNHLNNRHHLFLLTNTA